METKNFNKKRQHIIVIVVVIAVCVVVGLMVNAGLASNKFERQYATFIIAEEAYKNAATRPALEDNPLRREIGFLLAQIIQVEMNPASRIETARRGISKLNELEIQIDDIKDAGDTVAPLVEALDKTAGSAINVAGRAHMKEIVSLAKKNAEIISDIRGLSYRADYYTAEVFERVIDEQGNMSDEHITHLNGLIPQLEEQFNKRQNLYAELARNISRIKDLASEVSASSAQ